MNNFTLIAISIGLAMDAFAVSLSEGIALKRQSIKYGLIVGLLFGAFQAFMPLLGWYAGSLFSEFISKYSRIVSFILLLGIGCKMLYEAYESDLCEKKGICKLSGDLIMLGVATSIDALAIGFSFSLLQNINIFKCKRFSNIRTININWYESWRNYEIKYIRYEFSGKKLYCFR